MWIESPVTSFTFFTMLGSLYWAHIQLKCFGGTTAQNRENWENRMREEWRIGHTLNTALAPNLRISPWLRGDAVVTTLKPDNRAS